MMGMAWVELKGADFPADSDDILSFLPDTALVILARRMAALSLRSSGRRLGFIPRRHSPCFRNNPQYRPKMKGVLMKRLLGRQLAAHFGRAKLWQHAAANPYSARLLRLSQFPRFSLAKSRIGAVTNPFVCADLSGYAGCNGSNELRRLTFGLESRHNVCSIARPKFFCTWFRHLR